MLLLLTSCTSQQQLVDLNNVLDQSQGDVSILQNIQPRLVLGTIKDLTWSEEQLLKKRNDPYAQNLLYVMQEIRAILYPWDGYARPYSLTGDNPLISFFNQIRSGTIPTNLGPEYSLIYLNFAPLAVLYTDSPNVLLDADDLLISADLAWGDSFVIPFLRGVIQYKLSNTREGLRDINIALNLNPLSQGTYYKALILIELKEFESAKVELENLEEKYPNQQSINLLRGRLEYFLGNYQKAIDIYNKVIQLPLEDQYRKAESFGFINQMSEGITYMDSILSRNMPLEFWILYNDYQKRINIQPEERLSYLSLAMDAFPLEKKFLNESLDILFDLKDRERIKGLLQIKGSILTDVELASRRFQLAILNDDWKSAVLYAKDYPDIVPDDFPYEWELLAAQQNWSGIVRLSRNKSVSLSHLQSYWTALFETNNLSRLEVDLKSRTPNSNWPSELHSDYLYYSFLFVNTESEKLNLLNNSLSYNPINIKTLSALAEIYYLKDDKFHAKFYMKQLVLLDRKDNKWKRLLETW